MKKHFFAGCLVLAGSAWGYTTWFAVMGDTGNPDLDTIEADPAPLSASGASAKMLSRCYKKRSCYRPAGKG